MNPSSHPAPPPPAKKSWRSRILRWSIEIALVLGVFFLIQAWNAPKLPDKILPPLISQTLDGKMFDSRKTQGRPLVVHIWAEWCPVCRLELAGIAELAKDAPVMSIAWKSGDDAAMRRFLAQEKIDMPVINDPQGALLAPLGIKAVPLHLIVDATGRIHFVETGYITPWGLRARLWWVEHFAGAMPVNGS
ncbi:MAG: protein disulfide oxidoreductase [Halothiobacillaceae bacterium]